MSAAENKAVFLSYASQDAAAVLRIAEALRASGVEVWFDQNELVGGDAWDQKIRKQIKDCALFVPVISAATQARTEGYFRLEWRLADQRTHLMAKGRPFLLPVVIDATRDSEAHVPDSFTEVQWTRLPGGETPEKFCARVKKLLGGGAVDVGPVVDRAPGQRPGLQPERPASRPWLVPAIFGVIAIVALALWQPWRAKEKSAPPASPAAVTPVAPLTDAQQLVEKARKIFEDGDEMNRETYTLAEELLKKAETLDVTEGSAWALHAQVSAQSYLYGLDNSPTRREAMLMESARATKLMPDSLGAVLASANVRLASRQEIPALEESFKKLAEANPKDPQVLRVLVKAYGLDGKADDASDTARRALRLAPDDPRLKADLVNYLRINNRFAEAEAALTEAKKGRMNARLWAFDSWLRLVWQADSAGASASIRSWPSWFLLEDRGAALAAVVFMWNREPAKAIEVLGNFPRDEIGDTMLAGPRAAFTAMAREQMGQIESARADWRVALQVADRKLSIASDDGVALHWKAWALARLGDLPAANATFIQLREKFPSLPSSLYLFGGLAGLTQSLGQTAEVFNYLRPSRFNVTNFDRPVTKGILRLNPVFDPLRSDPRFQALVDAAPGPEEKKENAKSVGSDLSAVASAKAEKSLVVLPLENLSPDPENAFFTDGLHTEIISALQGVADLKVIGRDTALTLKRGSAPVAELAQRVGVANVITGSVRRAGNTVRIQLELRRASDDALLWSLPKGDRDLKDVLGLQSEVADQVARVLQAREAKGNFASAQFTTKDPRAYDLFLKAHQLFDWRGLNNQLEAVRLAEEAMRLDPAYATAANLLSHSHQRVFSQDPNPATRAQHAREAKRWGEITQKLMPGGAGDGGLAMYYSITERDALRALPLAENVRRALPNDAESYNYLGVALEELGRLPEAVDSFVRAEEIAPQVANYPRNLLMLYAALRRGPEARAAAERYRTLADATSSANVNLQQIFNGLFMATGELPADLSGLSSAYKALWRARARQFEPALEELAATMASDSTDYPVRLSLLGLKCDVLRQLGREAEAGLVAREALALATKLQSVPEIGPTEKPGWLALAQSRAGQMEDALAAVRRYLEVASPTAQPRACWQREITAAEMFAYAKRPRECIELLAKLLRVPSGLTVPMLKVDPVWDNVREDAAFKALLADPQNSAAL